MSPSSNPLSEPVARVWFWFNHTRIKFKNDLEMQVSPWWVCVCFLWFSFLLLLVKLSFLTCSRRSSLPDTMLPLSENRRRPSHHTTANADFFFPPVLRSSWRWWQSWMNDVFVHEMLYSKRREYLATQKATQTAPTKKTNTAQVFPPFFFPCIAGQVRDMVGQQLELAWDWNQISPKKETNKEQSPGVPLSVKQWNELAAMWSRLSARLFRQIAPLNSRIL